MDELQTLKLKAKELDYEIALAKFNGHADEEVLKKRLSDIELQIKKLTHCGVGDVNRKL